MTARDRILSAIRGGIGAPRAAPDAIAAEAAALLDDPGATRPVLMSDDPVEAFRIKTEAVGTTTERLAGLADVPGAVRRYLDGHGLPPALALQQTADLTGLDWSGFEVSATVAPDQPVALGQALWGIAESGSMVVHSAPDTPILLSFLARHHIVVLREAVMLRHLEDYAALVPTLPIPRNAVLITGPSGTTDIEGSYVRGAHGPGFVHVLLVGGG